MKDAYLIQEQPRACLDRVSWVTRYVVNDPADAEGIVAWVTLERPDFRFRILDREKVDDLIATAEGFTVDPYA